MNGNVAMNRPSTDTAPRPAKTARLGIWISVAAAVLTVVSLIIYYFGIKSEGYFLDAAVGAVLPMSVLSIVCLGVAVVLELIPAKGVAGKIVRLIADALRVVAAVLLVVALMNFISGRVEGLAYIYFSDPNILDTIQTPANMRSAGLSITGFVFYGIAWLVAVVASFFSMNRKKA